MTGWRRGLVHRAGAVLALAMGACGGGDAQDDRPVEIKFGHVGAPGSHFEHAANEFARRANERLGSLGEVVVYGSSQLGGDEQMLQRLKLGTLELALPSTVMSSTIDQFGLFEMPYLIRDREHMKRVEQAVVWPHLAPLAEQQGYHVLAVWENGFRHITNNRGPIVTPGDLDGIKLRTPRGRWRVRLFQSYGANPTPMPFSEVFIALQTGVVDGQENPLAQIYSAKLHEVQSMLSLTGHVYTPAFVTAGAGRWRGFSAEIRGILEETAREMQSFVFEDAARMDTEILDTLRASGMAVNEADREAFREASAPVYAAFATEVEGGQELLDLAHAARDASSDSGSVARN